MNFTQLLFNLFALQISKDSKSQRSESSHNVKAYARFSPLIGGPRFLPIHVEVMIMETTTDEMNSGNGSEKTLLRRIDFIPKDAEKIETILKLVTFQNVPAIIRDRTLTYGYEKDNDESLNVLNPINVGFSRMEALLQNSVSIEKMNFILPLDIDGIANIDYMKSLSLCVKSKEGSELNLLNNNCYSFAYDILQSLKG
ncbi:hypothetical protein CTEN210_16238 [Chaetoceros tenuissimus]|uniref:Uncharacterized protein n=1 Tax=Chaetoceros tenuissimus TaxID=426638 RepID=A0AAD3HDE2_9STRA|nr:hypothetical protein CTEN210_16238 [Chaetoceros tenuissimus]